MGRPLFYALVVPLLIVECVAQFMTHDQEMVAVAALATLAVVAVRWAALSREVRECAEDCPKCVESQSGAES
jgi:hypothetical protein